MRKMVFKLQRGLQQLPLDAMYTPTHHHVKRWDSGQQSYVKINRPNCVTSTWV